MEVSPESDSEEESVASIIKQSVAQLSNSTAKEQRKGKHQQSGGEVDDIVSRVLSSLIPIIISAVTKAVESSTKAAISAARKEASCQSDKIQQLALLAKYDNDTLEQYSRRENIRVSGISGGDSEEELIDEIISLGDKIGVTVKAEDISVTPLTSQQLILLPNVIVLYAT